MSEYTVADTNRNQMGPMSESEVRNLLAQGRITLECLAWKPGMEQWAPLRSFTEFIDVPNPPVGVPQVPYNPYAPPAVPAVLPVTEDGIDLNIPSPVRAKALADEVLARDYQLDIFGCVGRAWNLVFSSQFWQILGVSMLSWLTLAASSMCYANIVIGGPILGGLDLYYLKKIRGQHSDLNTAFSGFNLAFTQLFLVFLVSSLLTGVGMIFCFLPGVYLGVAWLFARTLVIDKKLDFWDAMECSRRVVHRHWFPVFGLLIVLSLLGMLSVLALIVGVFVAMPVMSAATMYAYEDIFNPGRQRFLK